VKDARSKPRPPARRAAPPPPARGRREAAAAAPSGTRWGYGFVWLLLMATPFLIAPAAKESFRLPKLLAGEWLALASLLGLAWELRRAERVRWADLWRRPALRAVVPLLAVATAGLATTAHPLHVRSALADLWIGAAALVGWSVGLDAARQERLLRALIWPAAALALLAVLQFHGLFQPLQLLGLAPESRLAITSTAGNPGDLAAYLVLPCLLAQWSLWRRRGERGWARWGLAAALALCLYALALTQTFTALAALVAGSAVLWAALLPRRRAALLLAAIVLAAVALVAAVPPLRARAAEKWREVRGGEWNAVLSGRLDGWRAAAWMFSRHPWTGVGQGAYLPEFVPAKLALLDRGVEFFPLSSSAMFANAHNEFLEAAAEGGVPGALALAWALWTLAAALYAGRARRRGGVFSAIAGGGTAALAVLALGDFPFRIALVAFPALLFLAWVLRAGDPLAREEPA
jgi:O-antigen ligase